MTRVYCVDRWYDTEQKYGYTTEAIFTSARMAAAYVEFLAKEAVAYPDAEWSQCEFVVTPWKLNVTIDEFTRDGQVAP